MAHTDNPQTRQRNPQPDREHKPPIASEKVFCDSERKKFFLDLNQNQRGTVLRIKEVSENGRFNFIMIPAEYLGEFCEAMEKIREEYYA